MMLYYSELKEDGIHTYKVKMSDRATFWADHPQAKEISRKAFEELEKLKTKTKQSE
jgi:hypothetical protein